MIKLGIEVFLEKEYKKISKKKIALLAHSASVNTHLKSSFDLIKEHTSLNITCLIGPQHGYKNTQQANMLTTEDENYYNIPLFSLYSSKTRRLTCAILDLFDVLIVDLQDVGCRVYTYLSTLFYVLEDCHKANKEVWVLDRPNPAGRSVEGSILKENFTSFVGASPLPIRHGLTLGELAYWYRDLHNLDLYLKVIPLENYQPEKQAWPSSLYWIPPSPNMVDEECALCYSGTVLLEGTTLSEGRGTVFPLKTMGCPGMNTRKILKTMNEIAPHWLKFCILREEFFKPVFDKFQNQVCNSIRIYIHKPYQGNNLFSPYRLISLFLKSFKMTHLDFNLFSPPPYEYEYEKMPIDILSGDDFLRNWVENTKSSIADLENKLSKDEQIWKSQRQKYLLY